MIEIDDDDERRRGARPARRARRAGRDDADPGRRRHDAASPPVLSSEAICASAAATRASAACSPRAARPPEHASADPWPSAAARRRQGDGAPAITRRDVASSELPRRARLGSIGQLRAESGCSGARWRRRSLASATCFSDPRPAATLAPGPMVTSGRLPARKRRNLRVDLARSRATRCERLIRLGQLSVTRPLGGHGSLTLGHGRRSRPGRRPSTRP